MTADANAAKRNHIEQAALRFCRNHYGNQGLEVGKEIDPNISWRPNFHLRKGPVIFAVEVSEVLDPTIFKLAANDILHFSRPVAVCLACPLQSFQNDTTRAKAKELRKIGVGVITVDGNGDAELQMSCVPLAQHISEELFADRIRELSTKLRITFRPAYETFLVNPGQGLQEAGQIVEAVVDAMAGEAVKNGKVKAKAIKGAAANRIDALWDALKQHRGALGGARAFLKTYRNIASHPAHSAKEAMKKINSCRDGFFQAIGIAKDLSMAMKTLGYRLRLHIA
jgi:hypothetical protein